MLLDVNKFIAETIETVLFKYEIDSVLSASIESVGFTILVELIWSFGFKSSRNKAANDNARKIVNSQ